MIVEDVQRHQVDADVWELSAQMRESTSVPDRRVWFRFSGDPREDGAPGSGPVDGSPFVVSLLLVAMLGRESLVVDAPVSARLLDHLPGVPDYYRAWYRGRIDEIKVDAPRALAVARCPLPKSRRWFWDEIEADLSQRTDPGDQRLLLAVRTLMLRDDIAKQRRRVRRLVSTARRVAWPR